MTESSAAVDHLDRTGVVRLATTPRDGREIVTKIWAVVVEGANDQVDEAFVSKYAGSGSALRMMITDDARRSTLRVTPVDQTG